MGDRRSWYPDQASPDSDLVIPGISAEQCGPGWQPAPDCQPASCSVGFIESETTTYLVLAISGALTRESLEKWNTGKEKILPAQDVHKRLLRQRLRHPTHVGGCRRKLPLGQHGVGSSM